MDSQELLGIELFFEATNCFAQKVMFGAIVNPHIVALSFDPVNIPDIEEEDANPAISLPTEKLGQRLDWLDTAIVELRDRSRLLQEEIMLKGSEQTNRSLHVLAIVTTVFLPASLVAGLFGVNVGGLPLAGDPSGFLWVIGIIAAASALVYWLLKRSGTAGR